MTTFGYKTTLAGWGPNYRVACLLTKPQFSSEVSARLDRNGNISRGLGRSYGDCAINSNAQVIETAAMNRLLSFEEEAGVLTCEAGTSIESIIETFAPQGWFPMITPGTKFVTVGGCIANDIHGKAHHAQGCFSNCVESMTVLLADGDVITASLRPQPSFADLVVR